MYLTKRTKFHARRNASECHRCGCRLSTSSADLNSPSIASDDILSSSPDHSDDGWKIPSDTHRSTANEIPCRKWPHDLYFGGQEYFISPLYQSHNFRKVRTLGGQTKIACNHT